jgi:hypothetical protein
VQAQLIRVPREAASLSWTLFPPTPFAKPAASTHPTHPMSPPKPSAYTRRLALEAESHPPGSLSGPGGLCPKRLATAQASLVTATTIDQRYLPT